MLIDQLKVSPIHHTYLPSSKDKLLAPILSILEQNPADNTSLEQWAKNVIPQKEHYPDVVSKN